MKFPDPNDPGRLIILANRFAFLMRCSGFKVAVAESLTGGQLQAACTMFAGASHFFAGGVTAYSIDQKVHLLQVDRKVAEASNCVSATVASQMAMGVLKLFNVDLAIATTGYADWDMHIKPHFHYALYFRGRTLVTGMSKLFATTRAMRQEEAVCLVLKQAITLLEIKA